MKAYLTSIGERTTDLCKWQLERFGFEVVLLDEKEPWFEKYQRFLNTANEDCIRIDADVIPNKKIQGLVMCEGYLMVQSLVYCFYRNDVTEKSPILYRAEALGIIRRNLNKLDRFRPETGAWRLPEIVNRTWTFETIVGCHGFFQRKEDILRGIENKVRIRNRQEDRCDFDLVRRIIEDLY